jgi:hypothetical protein
MFTTLHKRCILLEVLCALLFLGSAFTAHAQEANLTPGGESFKNLYPTDQLFAEEGDVPGDFVVGPGKVDLTINPGETKVVEILVSNRTGERKRFNITTEDTQGSTDVSRPVILLGDDRGPYSIKDYISVPHTAFDLEHNQRARIPVTITLPQDAEAGGLYGSVLVKTVAIEAQPGDATNVAPQSAIVARIGTLFFITIPGDVEREGELKDFSTVPKQLFYQSSPINLGILFENKGPIHLAPYGELRITNIFGEEVGEVQLEPWFVLPESLRLREVSWTREFLFGKYTATVYINRSYDDIVDEMSYTFWVLPWKPVAGAFLVLFAIFFTIRAFLRNFEFRRKQ